MFTYYQPRCWTGFPVEIRNQLFFTSSFSSSEEEDDISSFKWRKDKKWFALESLVISEYEFVPIYYFIHIALAN